jgi:hypothetical protein
MGAKGTPQQTRCRDEEWVGRIRFAALKERLPLRWPVPPDILPCPKRRMRSAYVYPGWKRLADEAAWERLSLFKLLLYLVDFGPLRPVLAQLMGWRNDRGYRPFDPVSIFLLKMWQLSEGWNRSQVIGNLGQPEYAEIVACMGFRGHYPTEGGLRYIETRLGEQSEGAGEVVEVQSEEGQPYPVAVQRLNELIVQSIGLLQEAGLITEQAWQQALVCPDGQLHPAASRMKCASVKAECYGPQPRGCAAREKGKRGCACEQQECHQACRYATPLDRQARFVWYSGSNQRPDNPNQASDAKQRKAARGKGVYGYRSLALQLCDVQHRFSLTLLADYQPANLAEQPYATAQLLQLKGYYPGLQVGWVAGDAGFGFEPFLHTVRNTLQARRVVDLRAHECDQDRQGWVLRGYDNRGRPLCPFGYALTANGYDAQHRRQKWTCRKACQKDISPRVEVPGTVYPPPECPYQEAPSGHGQVLNVGERFSDGSMRLVRDLPVGSPQWKCYYHQGRNAAEARNACHKALGLKQMPVYGYCRGKTAIFLADVWRNLSTLARLIGEATLAGVG